MTIKKFQGSNGATTTETYIGDGSPPMRMTRATYDKLRDLLAQRKADWLAMLKAVAELSDAMGLGDADWGLANDDILLEQFDPWNVLRTAVAKMRQLPKEGEKSPTQPNLLLSLPKVDQPVLLWYEDGCKLKIKRDWNRIALVWQGDRETEWDMSNAKETAE